jgi:3-deoxy-D-manno-octulosonic-acid transferase
MNTIISKLVLCGLVIFLSTGFTDAGKITESMKKKPCYPNCATTQSITGSSNGLDPNKAINLIEQLKQSDPQTQFTITYTTTAMPEAEARKTAAQLKENLQRAGFSSTTVNTQRIKTQQIPK